ncbi:uncharacterized protein MYCFIDRAFT_80279 [Pseudocercospora fijiensis CIRAD86]|uniref:Ig-like domain-containing protein n=1 Tax=Pseudocercospora fijiensis (strain CIRAD86) TaxID=383855 RepID=M2ZUG1_PSEFD|nr:uncharacterized protein MYCFIDRAFT_80279 [Pseudocercospora fijiensis CIRAD86]EME82644.1 hypothetical protein MYCFIDRAFT_80279 [Pseudocercospora fijiensis CIRAD86]
MVRFMPTILAAGLAIGAAFALPADIRATTSGVDTSGTTTTSTDVSVPTMSVLDVPSYTLRLQPNVTINVTMSQIPTQLPTSAPSVMDTSYTLRPDTDSVTTTSTIPATKTVDKRAVCTDAGIVHECDAAPPADGFGMTYTPSVPSDWAAPVCGGTSAYSGSTDSTLLATADKMCNSANWNTMVDPSETLRWVTKADDGHDMTFSIDFDWLAVPADQDTVLFNSIACHAGFKKLVVE